MNKTQILGLVRHILTGVGGYLVGRGIIDQSTMLEVVGGVVALVGVVWSFVSPEKKDA